MFRRADRIRNAAERIPRTLSAEDQAFERAVESYKTITRVLLPELEREAKKVAEAKPAVEQPRIPPYIPADLPVRHMGREMVRLRDKILETRQRLTGRAAPYGSQIELKEVLERLNAERAAFQAKSEIYYEVVNDSMAVILLDFSRKLNKAMKTICIGEVKGAGVAITYENAAGTSLEGVGKDIYAAVQLACLNAGLGATIDDVMRAMGGEARARLQEMPTAIFRDTLNSLLEHQKEMGAYIHIRRDSRSNAEDKLIALRDRANRALVEFYGTIMAQKWHHHGSHGGVIVISDHLIEEEAHYTSVRTKNPAISMVDSFIDPTTMLFEMGNEVAAFNRRVGPDMASRLKLYSLPEVERARPQRNAQLADNISKRGAYEPPHEETKGERWIREAETLAREREYMEKYALPWQRSDPPNYA